MRITRLAGALVALAWIVAGSPALARAPRPARPPQRADRLAARPRRVASPVAKRRAAGERADRAAYERLYVAPRAYPGRTIDRRALARAAELVHLWADTLRSPGTTALTGPCTWHGAGPTNLNGRVTGLAVDPSNPQRVFASTVGGLWRSLDEARTWERVSDQLGAACVGAVAVAPDRPDIVVAGQGDPNNQEPGLGARSSGIWVSTGGGDPGTWTRIAPPELADAIVTRVRIGPGADPEVDVATSAGVFQGRASTGWAFTRLRGMEAGVSDLAVDFSSAPPTLYAAVDVGTTAHPAGVWKYRPASTSSTWNRLASGFPSDPGVTALALAPSDPGILYAKVAHADGSFAGLYRRGASGGWLKKSGSNDASSRLADSFDYHGYNCTVEVDPGDPDRVYVGGIHPWFTPDASASDPEWFPMDQAGGDAYDDAAPHADQHAIAPLAGSPRRILFGNDGGIDLGIERNGPDGKPDGTYQWADRSHGMTITQFYGIASQDGATPALAGGSQDNGSELTFGNHTWYATAPRCDGASIGLDPSPSSTLYEFCMGYDCTEDDVYAMPNPLDVTHPDNPGLRLAFPHGHPAPPIATGRPTPSAPAGYAVIAACEADSAARLWFTTTGLEWHLVDGSFLPRPGDVFTSLAFAPSTGVQGLYVGYTGSSASDPASIWSRDVDPLAPGWFKSPTGLPNLSPNALAVDPAVSTTAYAALGGAGGSSGALLRTLDGGKTWAKFDGPGSGSAFAAPLTGVVVDPAHPSVLYVASAVGVYRVDDGTGDVLHAAWTPLPAGLPAGIDVTSLALAAGRRKLVIGTFGYGAYTYDLDASACPLVALNVRDNVFDDGSAPTPTTGIPDPEHPAADAARAPDANGTPFYVARTDPGDELYWWMSPDIRLHRFDAARKQNELAWVDNVGVETCPTDCADCLSGTNVDQQLGRGETDSVFVQVTNRGTRAATNVRVCALWGDASAALPMLPANFWTSVFPAGGECAAPDPASGWHAFDTPCVRLGGLAADQTAVATFRWQVPSDAPDHACVIAFAESDDDPIPSRAANELRPWVLVPNDAQVGQRNLHVVDRVAGSSVVFTAESLAVVNPTPNPAPLELDWSRGALPDSAQLALLLPRDSTMVLSGITKVPGPLRFSPALGLAARAVPAGLDTTAVYVVTAHAARIGNFRVAPGGRRAIFFAVTTPATPAPSRAARVSVIARQGKTVLGGSTWVLRSGGP